MFHLVDGVQGHTGPCYRILQVVIQGINAKLDTAPLRDRSEIPE